MPKMSAPFSPTISACSSESPKLGPSRTAGGPPTTRRRLVPFQTRALVSVFEVKTHPSREERALLAAELGMELKAVNAWFQNKRRTLKRTCSNTCGWSKGSLPENKHVRPLDGPKALASTDSAISLERVAASHELPYKARKPAAAAPGHRRPSSRPVPATPRKRRLPAASASGEIWELLPSSPPTRPSSPTQGEPLLALEPCTKRLRSLEWACAKARAERKAGVRVRALRTRDSGGDDDGDVPMLVLDDDDAAVKAGSSSSSSSSASSGEETETEEDEDEDEEAITPNVSTELLPPFILSADADASVGAEGKRRRKGKDMDMEAAIVLLGFMGPEVPT